MFATIKSKIFFKNCLSAKSENAMRILAEFNAFSVKRACWNLNFVNRWIPKTSEIKGNFPSIFVQKLRDI